MLWLDLEGERRSYGTVEPGARRAQHTYDGHAWLVLGPGGRELGTYRARAGDPTLVVLNGEASQPGTRREERREGERPRALSPDGRLRLLVRDGKVLRKDEASNEELELASDGSAEDAYTQQIWWSPRSTHVAVLREKPEQEHRVHLVESAPKDQVQPKLHSFQYLKPGDRIAHARPVLFDLASGARVPIDEALFPTPWSISRLEWTPDGKELCFLYNQRGHQLLRWLAIDAASGAVRTLIEEKSQTFIDYAGKLWLEPLWESGEALWMSERSGWNHLYLYDLATGQPKRAITSGEWVVRGVERIDRERRQIWFRASGIHAGEDPYHVHFGRVNIDGGEITWLTQGDGMHELRYGPELSYYVDTFSRVDLPPVHELRRSSDGALVAELYRASDETLRASGWRRPERFVAKGRDGVTDIHGILVLPSTFDPARRYPVIENIYAGPHDHHVPKRFEAWSGSRAMAELGFVVVQIDGMGTSWRSKAFHDVCWKNLGDAGFPDRIAWLRAAAATRPYLDLERVGIFGGSAGGQNALRGLLAHGDFYRVGVADCGCHDNRMDKIWWNELWMGWPIGPHYDEQSNVTQAHRLRGKLLLIAGELDRNVDPASTMQVAAALVRADKDFELLIIPGAGHGSAETPYGRRRRADFFVRHLLAREPRWTG
ncbi:MAG: prolyl oligopeptidase family serine peptidase [Planctomycetes bacterium]|nr:prolyl oligopeptidase family serine peptidase [Planctomycetota bacterium]